MEQKTYELKVAGLTRHLPLCPINEKVDIAAFIMFSDVELTVACAEELLKKVPEHDVILTAESKGIPLAYEMSRQSGIKYLLARKSAKLYMSNPVGVDVKSITTARLQTLYMDQHDLEYLHGKRVLIVDDVISTGESLNALEALVGKAGGNIVGKATVLAEGDAADRDDIIFLEPLPVFVKE
ncbi:MAG: adenine phosphoribosyltransferase [Oscillospiraceae bacterium]|nr:adenine phosphoribosyltransferase [Oscillospiraceae bacterium]MBQ3242747.1 adenine phosphoribosyltransferase [Oscillospiraceae bacterium]